jgi:hypothetical protein
MNEITPGIYHWDAMHPDIPFRVSSYYLEPAGIVLDPLEPEEGMGFFDSLEVAPQQVVLTCGLHWRHSDRFADRYGATVRAPAPGLHRYEGTGRDPEPYDDGDELAPGVHAFAIGGIAPDDFALHIRHGDGALALADALHHYVGELALMPDGLWGDPEAEKPRVVDSLRGAATRDFDTLLLAHGDPIAKGGRDALLEFLENPEPRT